MKKKLLIPVFVMVFTMVLSIDVHAMSHTALSSNNRDGITTVDDLIQEEEFQDEVKEYLAEKYGENYKEKLKRNENAVKNAEKVD